VEGQRIEKGMFATVLISTFQLSSIAYKDVIICFLLCFSEDMLIHLYTTQGEVTKL